jgi:hypothetical protein
MAVSVCPSLCFISEATNCISIKVGIMNMNYNFRDNQNLIPVRMSNISPTSSEVQIEYIDFPQKNSSYKIHRFHSFKRKFDPLNI